MIFKHGSLLVSLILLQTSYCAPNPRPEFADITDGIGDIFGSVTQPIVDALSGKKKKDAELAEINKKNDELKKTSEEFQKNVQAQLQTQQKHNNINFNNINNRLTTTELVAGKALLKTKQLDNNFNSVLSFFKGGKTVDPLSSGFSSTTGADGMGAGALPGGMGAGAVPGGMGAGVKVMAGNTGMGSVGMGSDMTLGGQQMKEFGAPQSNQQPFTI